MYEILFTDKAKKELKKLEHDLQKRILEALGRIRIRPESFVTKLVGESVYKFRVGDYRVLMDIDQGKLIILVLQIGHRKSIYK